MPTTDAEFQRIASRQAQRQAAGLVPVFGSGAPTANAEFIGQQYYDQTARIMYVAFTSGNGSGDWQPGYVGNAPARAGLLLPKWRAAIAKVRSRTGNARVLVVGDSTTIGSNNTGGSVVPNEYNFVASLLASNGVPAIQQSFMGNSKSPFRVAADPRVTIGTWSNVATPTTMGGGFWSPGAVSGAPLTFTTTAPVNTFRVWFAANAGQGVVTIAITGGTGGAASLVVDMATGSNGTNVYSNVYYATVSTTGAAANNAVTVTLTSGASNGNVLGIEAWDSATPSVQFVNAGWNASSSTDWIVTANTFSPLTFLTNSPYDLVIIKSSINDAHDNTAATFAANMQLLINAAVAKGDSVILETDNPVDTAYVSAAAQQAAVNVLYGLAASNNLVLVDNYARWGSYTAMNALGMFTDNLHPSSLGYADMAVNLAPTIIGT